jgi:predicted nuclease of predicted toxin-antitoxin system
MRFLVDECTGPDVARWLSAQGHEVFSVYDEARGASDDEIILKAHSESWILITNDKGFGERVYHGRQSHSGVIFMRLQDEGPVNKIAVLASLLETYPDRLANRFVVVTENRVRFARP